MEHTAGLLAGMRVVEAAAFVAAPLGGMTLALLGQHTEEVLQELLGIPAQEFGRLHDAGVVGQAG